MEGDQNLGGQRPFWTRAFRRSQVEKIAEGVATWGTPGPSLAQLSSRTPCQPQAGLCGWVLSLGSAWGVSQCIMDEGFLVPWLTGGRGEQCLQPWCRGS